MMDMGKILIADDEDTFLVATSTLLRDDGYECDAVRDARAAEEKLKLDYYDLLIADIKMPGNTDLEFVQRLPELAPRMPVILVTGYPTVHSAIRSIQLPVVAYLVKPVDFDELVTVERSGVEYSRVHRAMDQTRERLGRWETSLKAMQERSISNVKLDKLGSVESFLRLTQENIMNSFMDLVNVSQAVAVRSQVDNICHLINCPRLAALTEALESTVKVLEKTKSSFRSKEIGDLRRKLEEILAQERPPRNES